MDPLLGTHHQVAHLGGFVAPEHRSTYSGSPVVPVPIAPNMSNYQLWKISFQLNQIIYHVSNKYYHEFNCFTPVRNTKLSSSICRYHVKRPNCVFSVSNLFLTNIHYVIFPFIKLLLKASKCFFIRLLQRKTLVSSCKTIPVPHSGHFFDLRQTRWSYKKLNLFICRYNYFS